MNVLKSEPFLWIHFAGLAVVPFSLQVVWLGLSVGSPNAWFWLEFLLIAALGILPIVWMQWQRPFNFFSLLIVSLKPQQLTPEQRQILSLVKTKSQKVLTVILAILMLPILWLLYQFAPLASLTASFLPSWRIVGIAIAILGFLITNLFFQVSLSALTILLTNPKKLASIDPYPAEKINQDFATSSIQFNQILPNLTD